MARTLGVVIPAYRPDVDALADFVAEVDERLAPEAIRIELDAPAPGAVEALADLPAAVHVAETRRGKGAAITQGFEALDADVLAFVDADGSVPTDSLADVVSPVLDGEADLAVGSRRHPDADVRSHQTFARRWLGDRFAALARFVLDVPLYDYQCGAKAIDRETWQAVRGHLYEPGFAWDVELIAMAGALGARIREVPVVWIDRPGSTVDTLGTTLALGRALLAARHRAALVRDHPLNRAIESYRHGRPALVDRVPEDDD
ncbi:MAG TPA: glycosyltransferase [Halobacteriales archaeon]|nr:glycosyltransferase [Halobacteriales archaeon]